MEFIIKYLILPSNLIILFFISGFVLFFIRKLKRLGIYLLVLAFTVYIFFGIGPVSFYLLGNLEYQHSPLDNSESIKEVHTILVLTGYAEMDPKIPLSSRVNSSSAFRLLEAVRIFRLAPHSNIIITGYGDIPKIMKDLLISMGLPGNKILIENKSNSTFDSARNINKLLKNKRFILITSAGHMPRSMKVFKKLGMTPIPAPTDYLTRENYLAIDYLPSPLHLRYSDLAIHEYAAIFWYRLMNRI